MIAAVLALGACGSGSSTPGTISSTIESDAARSAQVGTEQEPGAARGSLAPDRPSGALTDAAGAEIPPVPAAPDGPLEPAAVASLDQILASVESGVDRSAIRVLGESGDPRVGWFLSDLLRFFPSGDVAETIVLSFNQLMGTDVVADPFRGAWRPVTDLMLAWDLPAPPGYAERKAALFTLVEPRWEPFFSDPDADIDWRWLSWGGVLIDHRPLGDADPCPRGCIPALDDPTVTDADGGDWYADDGIVFAVTINGESRAYPKHIMEVHEMVNDTLGGRRIGIPYCTLCGSAQAYLLDTVPEGIEQPVLRTSGLLSRSNKVMFDLNTFSVFDTFLGRALSGPLHDADVTLEQVTVVATTWGEWKNARPSTTIVAQDGGIGRSYPLDPLGGRDDDGPIFPVGDVDPRLPVQEPVIGIELPDGMAIAFPAADARSVLEGGGSIEVGGVHLSLDGGGIRAATADGELAAHQAFWFAWSQFRPDTLLWSP